MNAFVLVPDSVDDNDRLAASTKSAAWVAACAPARFESGDFRFLPVSQLTSVFSCRPSPLGEGLGMRDFTRSKLLKPSPRERGKLHISLAKLALRIATPLITHPAHHTNELDVGVDE